MQPIGSPMLAHGDPGLSDVCARSAASRSFQDVKVHAL